MVHKLLHRVRDLFASPAMAWKRIAAEREDIAGIYLSHLLPLTVLALVLGLLGWGVAAATGPDGLVLTLPMAISCGLVMLAMLMLGILLLAQGVSLLAPRFGGRSKMASAFALMAYGATPLFLAGFFALVPGAVWFCLLGLGVTLWLLWLGLPGMMRSPREKLLAYFAVVALGVLLWSLATVALIHTMQAKMVRPAVVAGAPLAPDADAENPAEVKATPPAEPAETEMPRVETIEDADERAAEAPATGALGLPPIAGQAADPASDAGDAPGQAPAPALPASAPAVSDAALQRFAQRLSAAIPASLAGMARDQVGVQPLSLPGLSGVAVNTGFAQGDKAITLNLVYVGPAPRQTLLGEWANATVQREDAERTERVHADGPRHVSEVARKDGSGASMRLLLANGVMLDADATGLPLEQLKAALAGLPLADIERLQPGP